MQDNLLIMNDSELKEPNEKNQRAFPGQINAQNQTMFWTQSQ